MSIPFSPPFVDDSVVDEVSATLRSGWITTGPRVRAFEEALGIYIDSPHVTCCSSATAGLMLALSWYGVGPGDEVIVPAYTYCATALAVIHCGATPVMVDVEEDFNVSARGIAGKLSSRTKAIIAVDIAGWPCDYTGIHTLLDSAETRAAFKPTGTSQGTLGRPLLVSDAAHAFGAQMDGRPFGTQADITVFSFHAVKNLTTAEGGCLSFALPTPFDNAEIRKLVRLMTLNGQTRDAFTKTQTSSWRYDVVLPGFKMNMPDVCAAIGLAQLRTYATKQLPERKRVVARYLAAFSRFSWTQLPPIEDATRASSRHLFMLRIPSITETQRDQMLQHCFDAGVSVNVHFIPLPELTLFRNLGYHAADYPMAQFLSAHEISLPVYSQLTDDDIGRVVDTVQSAHRKATS